MCKALIKTRLKVNPRQRVESNYIYLFEIELIMNMLVKTMFVKTSFVKTRPSQDQACHDNSNHVSIQVQD